MKKFSKVGSMYAIVVLLLGFMFIAAEAAPSQQIGPGEGEIEPEPEPGGGREREAEGGVGAQEAEPEGAALRINFEVSGHHAHRGTYVVRYPGGDAIASWYAYDGWTDSGWTTYIDLPRKTVLVEVVYYPDSNAAPTVMRILNHTPGTVYGWIDREIEHAIEVAWPDMPLRQQLVPLRPDGVPWPQYGIWWRRPPGMAGPPGGRMFGPSGKGG